MRQISVRFDHNTYFKIDETRRAEKDVSVFVASGTSFIALTQAGRKILLRSAFN
jgi:hypothetical protein